LQPQTDRSEAPEMLVFLGDHAVSLLLWALAVAFVIFSFEKTAPSPGELMEISGEVRQADAIEECRAWRSLCKSKMIVTIDGRPGRYHVRPRYAGFFYLLKSPRTVIRTYIEKEPSDAGRSDVIAKTWGLWINGRPNVTLEDALSDDNFATHTVFPVLAAILGALGAARFLREQGN
jgi:hypothetical protein